MSKIKIHWSIKIIIFIVAFFTAIWYAWYLPLNKYDITGSDKYGDIPVGHCVESNKGGRGTKLWFELRTGVCGPSFFTGLGTHYHFTLFEIPRAYKSDEYVCIQNVNGVVTLFTSDDYELGHTKKFTEDLFRGIDSYKYINERKAKIAQQTATVEANSKSWK